MITTRLVQISNHWGIIGNIVFALLLLAGCKSSTGIASPGAEIMKTEEAFFASVIDHSFHFDTFSARLSLDLSSMNQEFSSKAQLKMIRDDRLQISIQPFLGVEMFRIEISNDSIKMLNRMNKSYVTDSYQRLKREMEFDFNFQNLQALLMNRLFVPGENQISNSHFRQFRITKSNRSAELQLKDRNESFYTFTADGDERLLSTKIEHEDQILTWNYNQFQTIDNQIFPMKMTAQLSDAGQTQGTATLTFSAPDMNRPVTLDFNIPSGYNRVSLAQLLNSIRK